MDLQKNQLLYKKFIRLLKEKGAYKSYITELINNESKESTFVWKYDKNIKKLFECSHPALWLNSSFIWSGTEAGRCFWATIDDEWTNICAKIKFMDGNDLPF